MPRLLALILCLAVFPAHAQFRVMTYNIRFGSADDGPDRWELRREKVVETIRDLDAPIVGLQEAEAFQVRELLEALPRYAASGVFRDDGRLAGEGTPILFDRMRYALVSGETFWLSDTPEVPASNTWGAACVRICTRVRLIELETGRTLTVFNTHYDHVSREARLGSTRLLLRRVHAEGRGGEDPVIVMGDFNADESNPAYLAFFEASMGPPLRNAFRALHPEVRAGTYNAFKPDSDGGDRTIDHILVSPGLRVLDADIDRRTIAGRYPSDHFPVWVDLSFGGDDPGGE
jgi:endonuclease/exonuclease/phosphatase family metal-dependent hydrolase